MELKDKIVEQFNSNPGLHILFYFDELGDFREEVLNWSEPGINCIISEGKHIGLKYRLEKEFLNENVFLYFPHKEPTLLEKEDFPLLDLLLANKQLYLDPVRSFIEEYGLFETYAPAIQRYYKQELRFKNRQEFLASVLTNSSFSFSRLKRGLACFHLGLPRIMDPNFCVARLMILALDQEAFVEILDKLQSLDLIDDLIHWIEDIFEIREKELSISLMNNLANVFKYNLITRTLDTVSDQDQYVKLRLDAIQVNRLWGFYLDWSNDSILKLKLDDVFSDLATQVSEDKLIEWYGLDAPYGYWSTNLKDKVLVQCIEEMRYQPVKIKERIKSWYDQIENEPAAYKALINFIWCAASMHELLKGEPSFRFNSPEEYIRQYTNDLYRVDMYARQANYFYAESLKYPFPAYFDIEASLQQLNESYESLFVSKINYEWMQCLKEKGFDFNAIQVPKQYNFYKDQVEEANQKIAVIISDAFRYEIAEELVSMLSSDSKNIGKVTPMLASVPSNTALGMSNLLPNKGIDLVGKGFVIDGISTEGIDNRDQILKKKNPSSKAISFKDLISLSQQQGRDIFKQYEIVYIYHNRIDAIGDSSKSEMGVFQAVNDALGDIRIILQKILNWNVSKTIITADHGFLMSVRKVGDTMKEDMPEVSGEFLMHNRCVVAEQIKDPGSGYLFDISKSSVLKSPLKITVPRSVNRYRKQGSGDQYVHCGASLQELIVPVVVYSRRKIDESVPVNIRLIKFDQRITSGYLKVDILQIEPLGTNIKERTVNIGLYANDGEPLSQIEKVVFNATSSIPTERTFKIMLNLGSRGTRETTCLLKGYNEGDTLNPLFEERIIIQTLIEKDEF